MPEALVPAFVALFLLAAASHRFRRDSGLTTIAATRVARAAAAVLLLAAWWRCGGGLGGERLVRFVVCVSVAAIPLVLLLSIAATVIFAPLRIALGQARR